LHLLHAWRAIVRDELHGLWERLLGERNAVVVYDLLVRELMVAESRNAEHELRFVEYGSLRANVHAEPHDVYAIH
jgi:hypothetical protein